MTPLVKSLREELYCERYEDIDWAAQRFNVSTLDVYYPHTWLNRLLFGAVNLYEAVHSTWVRDYALELTIDHIRQEGKEENVAWLVLFCNPFFCLDRNTNHIDIGPVNKCINMLAVYWADGPDSENFKVRRVFDFVAQFLKLCVSLFV